MGAKTSAAIADGGFTIEAENLREILGALKEFEPKLARDTRRELRKVGDEIIAEQRSLLGGAPPPRIAVTGAKTRLVVPKDGRAPYFRKVNVYEERERGMRDYNRGMRKKIGEGLKTAVSTGQRSSGVTIRTNRRAGGEMSQVYQSRKFRHPVFGTAGSTFVYQQGVPYFWGPAYKGAGRAADAVDTILADAINTMAKG